MALISNAITRLADNAPYNSFLSHLAYLLNIVFKLTGSAMTTAITDASVVDIATLRTAIEGLTVKESEKRLLRQLSDALLFAYNRRQMDSTDIAAFLTVNSNPGATTDMLWGLCTQHNGELTATYKGDSGGAPGAWYPPSSAEV